MSVWVKTLAELVVRGGFPAAIARTNQRRRAAWYRDYADTMIQRDIQDLARISAMDALQRLLPMAAGQTLCLLNVTELAAPFQISRQTIRDYLTLLSRIFLVDELPPGTATASNGSSRHPNCTSATQVWPVRCWG